METWLRRFFVGAALEALTDTPRMTTAQRGVVRWFLSVTEGDPFR